MIIAAVAGIAFFVTLFKLPEKRSLGILILLIPFAVIDTRYGPVNLILIFVAAFAFLLQGRLTRVPLLGPILLIFFAFMIAFSQSQPETHFYHIIYMVGFVSNILLFYMVYNYVSRTNDWQYVVRCLIWLNVAVLVYCAIQFASGDNRVTFLGIRELSLLPIRKDGRLVGPFNATAATAEYFTFQCLILGYLLLHKPAKLLRRIMLGMIALNLLFLIATGNRGGFVTVLVGMMLFMLAYRRELGLARIAKMTVGSVTLFTFAAIVVVNYTDYNMLFDRLEGTEIEGGVPDTRAEVWPIAWQKIVEKPIMGHGPRHAISTRNTKVESVEYVPYPHNLLLEVLYTTGIVGVVAWITFFTILAMHLFRIRKARIPDRKLATLPKLGLIILLVFFVSQLRIEFLRGALLDYQNYLFVLFALFLSTSDLIRRQLQEPDLAHGFGKSADFIRSDPRNLVA